MLANALKSLSKHSIVYISAIVFNKSISFLLIPLVTAYIGAIENYGVKEIAEVSIALMVQLLGFNVFQGMVRYLAEDDDAIKRGQTLNTSLCLVAGCTGALLALCLIFDRPIATVVFGSEKYAPALKVTAAILFFSVFTRWGLAYLEAQHKSVIYSVIISSKLLLEVGLKIVFLVFMDLTYMGVLYSVFWGEVLFGAGLFIVLIRRYPVGFSVEIARRLLVYATPLILSGACMFVVHQGDRFFIRIFDGLEGTGLYGLGYKLGSIVNALLYSGFATIWFPLVFKITDEEELRQLCRTVLTIFAALASFLTLVLTVFGPELLWIMVPETFQDAVRVLPIIAFSYLFWIVYQLVHTVFFIREKTNNVFVIAFVVAVLNTALNIFLVPKFGYIGAAWSTLAAYFVAAGLAYVMAQRLFHVPYDLGRLAFAIGLAALLWILSQVINFDDTSIRITTKIAICFSYPLLLLGFGYLTPQERNGLFHFVRSMGR